MHSIAAIVLLPLLLEAQKQQQQHAQTSMDNLMHKLVDKLLLPEGKGAHPEYLDETMLGKPGTIAMPSSRLPLFSTAPMRGSSIYSLQMRPGLVPNSIPHGLPRGPVKAEALRQAELEAERFRTVRRMMLTAFGLVSASALSLFPNYAKAGLFGGSGEAGPLDSLGTQIEGLIVKKYGSGELPSLPEITRLVLHDALTYDPETKTGGFDGSIRLPDELKRAENKGLAPVVKKLENLQKELQTETGVKISFADTEAFAIEMIASEDFKTFFCSRMAPPCSTPYNAYGNKPPRLQLGRQDADKPAPEGRVPAEGSSLDDFMKAFSNLRIPLAKKYLAVVNEGLFEDAAMGNQFLRQDDSMGGILKGLEASKDTNTQTSYQVSYYELIAYLTQGVGANLADNPYDLQK